MAATLEKIYEVALHHYHMKLVAGREGLSNLVDWVHVVEEMDYVHFLKGRELIITTGIKEPDDAQLLAAIWETIWAKPREHHFNDSSMPATRGMYRIGG